MLTSTDLSLNTYTHFNKVYPRPNSLFPLNLTLTLMRAACVGTHRTDSRQFYSLIFFFLMQLEKHIEMLNLCVWGKMLNGA